MTLSNLIRLSFFLTFIGVFLAIGSICIPWLYTSDVSDSRWQAAGQISSTVASIFGMLIASAALFAYLKTEEVGQTQSDSAYQQKLRLEQAIHQYCVFYERITMTLISNVKKEKLTSSSSYNFLVLPSLSHLQDASQDALKSDLYEALGSIKIRPKDGSETNGGMELAFLHFHIRRMIATDTINIDDAILKKNMANLIYALREIRKENIYKLIHQPLDDGPFDFLISRQ